MVTRRRFLGWSSLFLGSTVATACASAPEQRSLEGTPTQLRVAILLPGPKDDGSWNTTGYQGALLIEDELQAEVTCLENVSEDVFEQRFSEYAEQGYDFIIGHGGQFIAAAESVADTYPRVNFAVVGQYGGNNKNLGAISFRESEVGYLAGALAAMVSENKKVAYVGGEAYSHGKEKAAFFQKGAIAIDKETIATDVWLGTWSDSEIGETTGAELIADGFDVIVVDADSAGLPIHQQAKAAGISTIGWAKDQSSLAPSVILTSAEQDVALMMLKAATIVQKGQWEGKQYKFGLQDGVQKLSPLNSALPTEVANTIKGIESDLKKGKIELT